MQVGSFLWAAGAMGVVALGAGWLCTRERKRRLAEFSRARPPMAIQEQHQTYYSGYAADLVAVLLSEIGRIYGVAPTLLRPDDRFDTELRRLSLSAPDINYEMVCSLYRQQRKAAGKETGNLPPTVAEFVHGIMGAEEASAV